MKKSLNYLILLCLISLIAIDISAQKTIIVRPKETNIVLVNPGIGFSTFQRFNGDKWDGYQDCLDTATATNYKNFNGPLKIDGHPLTSLAYFRIRWRFIEPEDGKIQFDFIDRALETAYKRNQTLMLCISPYILEAIDLPDWLMKMWKKGEAFDSITGIFNFNNSLYVKYYSRLIRALGNRYDGHPYLQSVDVRIVGSAGEGGGTNFLTDENRKTLVNAYKDTFKKTQLIIMCRTDEEKKNVFRDFDGKNVGWRLDCLGDVGFEFSKTYSHMFDYYPQAINRGMQDVWKEEPVVWESCWDMKHWAEKGWDIDYIIQQSLKWHISSFNNKSQSVPAKWENKVDEWLKKMGYRFVLRRFSYPESIGTNEMLRFETWWENKGVAPLYNKNFLLAIRLTNEERTVLATTCANINSWLPGDNLYDDAILVPPDMPPGIYQLQIGIVDCQTHEPRVNLAIEGGTTEGWYPLGKITVK